MLATGAKPAAPRVGADLARARERLSLSVDEIGAALRIRPAYLIALEEGRVGELPGGSAYALAFLRSYAEALGLDPEAMARRFKAEAVVLSRTTELTFPAPAPERRLPAGAAALLASVLAIGVYAGWYQLSGEGRLPPETVAQVPARLVQLTTPVAPPPVAASAMPLPDAAPAVSATAASPLNALAAETPVIAVSPGSAAAAMPVLAPRAPAPAGEADVTASGDAAAPPRLLVRATADAWLQVRDRTGAVLFSRVLRAGETWPVPARPGLVLTTGNAGGTVLVVDGVATAPLGTSGAVRRDLPLDLDEVKAGRLAATPALR
jgi:cytoskeleton protein RodZ